MTLRDRLYITVLCLSAASITTGAALAHLSAGLIVGGLLAALLAWLVFTDDPDTVAS